MENLYRVTLEQYLNQQFHLERYNMFLKNSDLHFIPAEKENVTTYQQRSFLNLDYIYIRNDIYLDRLSDDDLNILSDSKKKLTGAITIETELPEDLVSMVIRTFPNVISPQPINNDDDTSVLTAFENSISPQLFPMNAIVIHIIIQEEFDPNGEYIDEENELQKNEFVKLLCEQIEADLDKIIPNSPVCAFPIIYQ